MSEAIAIRELSLDELRLVSGGDDGWTWGGLGTAMVTGAVTGAMAGSLSVVGFGPGALGGALIGGAGYLTPYAIDYLYGMWNYCF
jgi:hypothetical protein